MLEELRFLGPQLRKWLTKIEPLMPEGHNCLVRYADLDKLVGMRPSFVFS